MREIFTGEPTQEMRQIAQLTGMIAVGLDQKEGSWQMQALCAQTSPDAFNPKKGESTRAAKRVCLQCVVREDCLEYALDNDERFGVWGGLSERERRKLKRGY